MLQTLYKNILPTIDHWQTLIGAIIGAMSPFVLWWITDHIRRKNDYYDKLYHIEKLLVDQTNNIIEARRTIRNFIDKKLNTLIENIKQNDKNAFSIDYTFFPLFSTIPLNDEILRVHTKSGYIDNKIAKTYQLSKDMPFIMEDLRRQFFSTIQLNRDLALNKINPPEIQKINYIDNIKEFISVLEHELLDINFPVYLKILTETRVALDELNKIHILKWKLKFDPKYRFFKNDEQYNIAKKDTYNKIENYFKNIVEKNLLDIEKME